MRMQRKDPLRASIRSRFLAINICSNFVLNFLAFLGIGTVDWVSHLGALITGGLCWVGEAFGQGGAQGGQGEERRTQGRALSRALRVATWVGLVGMGLGLGVGIFWRLRKEGVGIS